MYSLSHFTMRPIYFPFRRQLLSSFLIISIVVLSSSFTAAQSAGGLWGSVKEKVEPINDTIRTRYNRLSDRNRFITGACVGFGASRIVIGTTMKTVKTIGAAYVAFEALEYAGILKEARRTAYQNNQPLLEQSRDYCLRTFDSIRHDMRTQLNPKNISKKVNRSMKKDKPGTVGFGTGAFLGFVL